MNLSDFDSSRYLAGKDVGDGITVTIAGFGIADLRDGSKKPYVNWVQQGVKPMLLNKTNRRRLAEIFGTDDTDQMYGKKVQVYYDTTVDYGGKTVGGLRLRAVPKSAVNPQTGRPYANPAAAEAAAAAKGGDFDDAIPF